MSRFVDILSKAIASASTDLLFESDIKNILKELDECPVKIYREDKSKPLPVYAVEGDACMDVYATSIEYDKSKDRYIVHTGLHFELPDDYEIQLRPRSSNGSTEWYIPNTPSTIDWGYRGEMRVIFKCRTSDNIINCIGYLGETLNPIIKANTDSYDALVDAHSTYKDIKENNKFPYKVGDRVCQILVCRRERVIWNEVESLDELSKTERGNGGFGHTGH